MTESTVMSRYTHEELFRHLLVADEKPDENTVYSFLLGYRLYQSPNQLLSEINQRTTASSNLGYKQFHRQKARKSVNKQQQCSQCNKTHDNVQRKFSKSTNNMLDNKVVENKPDGLYVQLAEHKALMNASIRGRKSREAAKHDVTTTSSDDEDSSDANKTEDLVDLDKVFTEENRRYTAPANALDLIDINASENTCTANKGTDFSTNKFVSKKYIHVVEKESGSGQEFVCADGVVASGEDTIRRRRKGRRRQISKTADSVDNSVSFNAIRHLNDCQSVASRDSGILSGCADEDEYSNATSSPMSTRKVDRNIPNSESTTEIKNDDCTSSSTRICSHYENVNEDDCVLREKSHLLSILNTWVSEFPSDFRNKKLRSALQNVTSNLKNEHNELTDSCVKIVDTLSRHLATQEAFEQKLRDSERKDSAMQADDFKKTKEWMIDILTSLNQPNDAARIARQLCIIEKDLIQHVGGEEFLQMFTANGDEDTKTNLGACVRWFNHLSHLVATSVCLCRKVKHRQHTITLFTRAAAICYDMSNFNSAMAILTGLNLGAVARLNKTWNKLSLTDLNKLQMVFDPSNNFRKYRTLFNQRCKAFQQLKEIETQKILNRSSMGSTSKTNRFSTHSQHSVASRSSLTSQSSQHRDSGIECENESPKADEKQSEEFIFAQEKLESLKDGVLIPFLTLLVKDVYFLNHSTPTVEANGSINFEKLRHLGELLKPLGNWKQKPCTFKVEENLSNFLMHSPVLKDAELYLLSYKREPPRNRFEKNQLKNLRVEFETKKRTRSLAKRMSRRKTM